MRLLWSLSSLGALVSQALFLLAFQIPSTAGKSLPHRVRDRRKSIGHIGRALAELWL